MKVLAPAGVKNNQFPIDQEKLGLTTVQGEISMYFTHIEAGKDVVAFENYEFIRKCPNYIVKLFLGEAPPYM